VRLATPANERLAAMIFRCAPNVTRDRSGTFEKAGTKEEDGAKTKKGLDAKSNFWFFFVGVTDSRINNIGH
jgi:hypothetical protein